MRGGSTSEGMIAGGDPRMTVYKLPLVLDPQPELITFLPADRGREGMAEMQPA